MTGLSFVTHGWLCPIGNRTIINKYIIPYNLAIKDKSCFDLQIKEKENITLNLSNIIDKQLNLKLTEEQINIKKNLDNQINLENEGC